MASASGIMTSKGMPGAGDVARGNGGFQYSHPIVQLYDNPYMLLDRFQLAKLADKVGKPIKVQVVRGISNMPGTDKLVQHFVNMENMGHVRRETMIPLIEEALRAAEDAKRPPLSPQEEEIEVSPPTAPHPEVLRIAGMGITELKIEAKKLGVAVARGEKRGPIVDKIFAALGVRV